MKSSSLLQSKSTKIQPVKPAGIVNLAGEELEISTKTIQENPGGSTNEVIKGLKQATKKSIFNPPAFMANE